MFSYCPHEPWHEFREGTGIQRMRPRFQITTGGVVGSSFSFYGLMMIKQDSRLTVSICNTGFSSEIGTKLRDWAVGQAGGSCYSWAALSSNDSKTLYTELRPVGLEVVWHFCPWMRARVNRKQFTLLRASTDRSAKQPLGQRDAIWCSFISLANHVAKMCMLQNLMAGEIEVEGNSSQLSVRHGSP